MKHIFCLLIISTLLVNTLSAASIRVAHQKGYPPYASINEQGEPTGILIDWWKLWSEKANTDVVFVAGSHDECIQMVLDGKADVMAGTFLLPDTVNVRYSEFILKLATVLFVKKGLKPRSIHDIKVEVGVLKDEPDLNFIHAQYPKLIIKLVSSAAEMRELVDNQQLDAFIYDVPKPFGLVNKSWNPKGYDQFYELREERLRTVISPDNNQLDQLIVKGASAMSNEELLEIATRYDLYVQKTNATWLYIVLISALSLFLIVLVIQKRKHSIQAKKIADFEAKDWQTIIQKGENDRIEFKSSLRWDYRQEKINKALEHVIVKTISAFLNTEGGMLFIGVDDNGTILGLEKDYQGLSKKNADGFVLALTNLINQHMGKNVHRMLNFNVIKINDLDVCIVSIDKSNAPIFMGNKGDEEFYIRASASSQPLGMSEAFEYIQAHWNTRRTRL